MSKLPKIYYLLVFAYCMHGLFMYGQEPTEANLQEVLESELAYPSKLKTIDSLVESIDYYTSDLPIVYRKKAIGSGKKIDEPYWVGELQLALGVIYCNLDELDSSLVYLNLALDNYESISYENRIASVYGLLRYVYTLREEYPKALKYAYDALNIYEKLEYEKGIGASYNDISGVLIPMEKYDEALNYALMAIETLEPFHENYNDTFELAMSLDKAAAVYSYQKDSVQALGYINRAIALYEGNIDWQFHFFHGRANIFRELGALDTALKELYLVRDWALKRVNQTEVNDSEHAIAEILHEQGKHDEALGILLKLYQRYIDDPDAAMVDLSNINENLYKVYEAIGQYEQSFIHFKQFTTLKDSAFSIAADRSMAELRTSYETEQKESKIQQLEDDKKQQRLIIFLGLGLLVFMGIFALFLYRVSLERKRNNTLLQQQKIEIEQKSNQNELLLKEIHHRVKNNLQTISSLLFLQSVHIKDESVREAVAEGQHRVEAMALIHQKLYQRENLAGIEMKDYLQNLSQTLIGTFWMVGDRVKLIIDMQELELDVDTAVPIGLIVNELLTNSLKYAFPDETEGEIRISLAFISDDELQLIVKDNGQGLKQVEASKGTAFGSQLVEQLTIQLAGAISTNGTNGYSTTIVFQKIPKLS